MVARLARPHGEDTPGSRFLAVVGPSGSGKSSLVRAGSAPGAPTRRHSSDPDRGSSVDIVPGARPFDELGSALLRVRDRASSGPCRRPRGRRGGLVRAVAEHPAQDRETELVLVVDQLEELFTLIDVGSRAHARSSTRSRRRRRTRESRLRIVVTLRADFYRPTAERPAASGPCWPHAPRRSCRLSPERAGTSDRRDRPNASASPLEPGLARRRSSPTSPTSRARSLSCSTRSPSCSSSATTGR